MTDTLQTKLGTTRAGPRTRVWIEGERLQAAGFYVGRHFLKTWQDGSLQLVLCPVAAFASAARADRGTVSGKAGRPVIDITGTLIAERFTGTHVQVAYGQGTITVTN